MSKKNSKNPFPKDFIWGVSTSAYQNEGAVLADGKGPSIWDAFCKRKDAIWKGYNGDIACDHYHRYREDVALMKKLGVKAHRFSVSWPRVMPKGSGKVNPKGLDFYNRLIDEMLKAGIEPHLTLYHWDLPLALSDKGGWHNRDVAGWFADYTQVAVNAFSDRVKHWYPVNEPQCIISLGYYQANYAPGIKLTLQQSLQAGHHLLLANGIAAMIIRGEAKQKVKVGLSVATQIDVYKRQR